jgi:LAS superfamily LD-carboxypeptidase LdcB
MPWVWIAGGVVLLVLLGARKALAYVNGQPAEVELVSIGGGYLLRADAAEAFGRMRAAAAGDGVFLKVNSAFRTMGEQETLWDRYLAGGNLAARPGYSPHQSGVAVDIQVDAVPGDPRTGTNAASRWLETYARNFRFYRIPAEAWHWEFHP